MFIHFIGNNWIGTFGLATGIAITLVILTRKNKLGWFGKMFVNQVTRRLKKGKLKKLIYAETFFFIIGSIYILTAIHYGDTIYTDKDKIQKEDLVKFIQTVRDLGWNNSMPDWEKTTIEYYAFFSCCNYQFGFISNMVANMNVQYHGWVQTLYTLILFQQIETFGIIQLYRKTLIRS